MNNDFRMRRFKIVLVLAVVFLAFGRAEALEESQLCWHGVCAGMTLRQVKKQFRALGFAVYDNWVHRWLQSHTLSLGGVYTWERYTEHITATTANPCDAKHRPCTAASVRLVRFPSGRRRLVSLGIHEWLPFAQTLLPMIQNARSRYGVPERATWNKGEDEQGHPSGGVTSRHMFWSVGDPLHSSDWLAIGLRATEPLRMEHGTPSPDAIAAAHVNTATFTINAMTVGFAAETAWDERKGGWIADASGCRFWNYIPRSGDTITWSGACMNGYGSGYGTLRWSTRGGSEYEVDEGPFRNGKLDGHAVVAFHSGRRFDGVFWDGRPNGPGVLTVRGTSYSGNWRNGCLAEGKLRAEFYSNLDDCDELLSRAPAAPQQSH